MTRITRREFAALSGLGLAGAYTHLYGQRVYDQIAYKTVGTGGPFQFPAPRDPDENSLPKINSVDDLMPAARVLASRPPKGMTHFHGYGVEAGQKVLLIAVDGQMHPWVPDAITKALRERGVRVDRITRDPGSYEEAEVLDQPPRTDLSVRRLRPGRAAEDSVRPWFADFAIQQGYKLVVEGMGGFNATMTVREFLHERFWVQFTTPVKFAVVAAFPPEVREAIEKKVSDILLSTRRVHITDPEGTDVSYSIFPEMWGLMVERERIPRIYAGHQHGTPYEVVLDKSDGKGVIAGSLNHSGPYPAIKVHLEGQQVVKIEGGGDYGDAWRELNERYKNQRWPNYPRPGYSWMIEVAIGTHPLALPGRWWSHATRRSGIIHFGFGVEGRSQDFTDFVKAHNVVGSHAPHIHVHFPTFECTMPDGRKVNVIEKGRLTALDDPEVRQLASKYGDPDRVLSELWIPAIPGINAPGRYERDYAPDPARWIMQETARLPRDLQL